MEKLFKMAFSANFFANIHHIELAAFSWETGRLGKPVDKSEWWAPPHVLSAYYNPSQNEIVFTAAVLQPPLFQ